MKTLVLVLVSLVVGVAVGLRATSVEFSKPPIMGKELAEEDAAMLSSAGAAATIPQSGQPHAEFIPVYKFGFQEVGVEASHKFKITNQGDAPLEIALLKTSCQCTVGTLGEGGGNKVVIPPRESADVTLTWTPKTHLGEFRQHAQLESNDPLHKQITLTVEGQVTQTVVASPADLVFTSLTASQPITTKVRVYGFRSEPIALLGHRLEDASTAEFFQLSYHPLEKAQLEEAQKDHPGATSAWEVDVHIKSGLPLGPIQQKIVLETNVEKVKALTVLVHGNVTSDLKVLGKDFNQGVLEIGTVDSRQGAKRTLLLLVRQQDFKVEVARVEPEFLQVTIGQPVLVNNGNIRVPVEISVPVGSEAVSYLGGAGNPYGEVLLKTNHADSPQIRVRVQFAVQR